MATSKASGAAPVALGASRTWQGEGVSPPDSYRPELDAQQRGKLPQGPSWLVATAVRLDEMRQKLTEDFQDFHSGGVYASETFPERLRDDPTGRIRYAGNVFTKTATSFDPASHTTFVDGRPIQATGLTPVVYV